MMKEHKIADMEMRLSKLENKINKLKKRNSVIEENIRHILQSLVIMSENYSR